MDGINYNYVKLPGRDSIVRIDVKLAGKKVGEIRRVDNNEEAGWAYFPQGRALLRGDVYPTVNLVKSSLEAE